MDHTTPISKLLDQREATHGDYNQTAKTAQIIKHAIRENRTGRAGLSDTMAESLDMIVTKIARIVSGSAAEPDHWRDIMGYCELVLRTIEPPRDDL